MGDIDLDIDIGIKKNIDLDIDLDLDFLGGKLLISILILKFLFGKILILILNQNLILSHLWAIAAITIPFSATESDEQSSKGVPDESCDLTSDENHPWGHEENEEARHYYSDYCTMM